MLSFLCFVQDLYSRSNCLPNAEVNDRLQELQRCVGTIKVNIQTIINNEVTIIEDLSILQEVLCSKIDMIGTVTSECTVNFNPVIQEISASDALLCSKIESLENFISIDDQLILSAIENITIPPASGIDVLISASDALLCSKIESLEIFISIDDQLILSAIENITVPPAQISGIDVLISASDALICSKIESLENFISIDDQIIISAVENITIPPVQVSGIEELISASDVFICSKIGNFDDPGSCLDSMIDVPDGINNLNLNVIELLKTILLELRGCPCQ